MTILPMGVRQVRPESPPPFNLFMDFAMQVFLDKCTNICIKFPQLKYRIPVSATHSKMTTAGQHALDLVGCADDLVFLFEGITNLELALHI